MKNEKQNLRFKTSIASSNCILSPAVCHVWNFQLSTLMFRDLFRALWNIKDGPKSWSISVKRSIFYICRVLNTPLIVIKWKLNNQKEVLRWSNARNYSKTEVKWTKHKDLTKMLHSGQSSHNLPLIFPDGGRYHTETSPLICGENQWTGFYMISASVMKRLKWSSSTSGTFYPII